VGGGIRQPCTARVPAPNSDILVPDGLLATFLSPILQLAPIPKQRSVPSASASGQVLSRTCQESGATTEYLLHVGHCLTTAQVWGAGARLPQAGAELELELKSSPKGQAVLPTTCDASMHCEYTAQPSRHASQLLSPPSPQNTGTRNANRVCCWAHRLMW